MIHTLQSADVQGKAVLVRLDLDLPKKGRGFDDTRLEDGVPTLRYLFEGGASKVTVIAHRGRPEGKRVPSLTLAPIEKLLRKNFTKEQNKRLVVLSNLRFDPGEEKNSPVFAKKLAKGQDLFVNDAFASSHREHASIVGIPQLLPSYFGLQFDKELHGLEKVVEAPKRPFVAVIGGAKLSTKLKLLELLEVKADVLLVGGKLAAELAEHPIISRKLIVAALTKDGKDISPASVDQFSRFIAMAHTIVWNGPMGVFEDSRYISGTRQVAQYIAKSRAYTVVGGGDTEAALEKLKITKGFSFISSGGGAMLEYVAYGKLLGIEAVLKSKTK